VSETKTKNKEQKGRKTENREPRTDERPVVSGQLRWTTDH
jgi:hypothetical protein